jgi:hypothetical protein
VAARSEAYNRKMRQQFAKAHKIIDQFPNESYVYRLGVDNKKKSRPKYSGPYCVVTMLPSGGYLLRETTGKFSQPNSCQAS